MTRYPGFATTLSFAVALSVAVGSSASASLRSATVAPSSTSITTRAPESARLSERGRFTFAAPVKELASEIVLSNGIEFDTRSGEPSLPASLRTAAPAPGERVSLLVQVEAPVQSAWMSELERAGAQVVAFVPNYAFLVRTDIGRRSAIQALPFVTWTGFYHPAYRISGQAAMQLRSGRGRYQMLLFPDANVADVQARVTALGGTVEDVSQRVNKILRFELDRSQVEALASHPDVQWIEPRSEFHLVNDQCQWVDQTNINGNRRVWDMGLDGTGQVVMLGDSGIRTSHDMFRDALVPITAYGDYPTHRKIIAYKPAQTNNTIVFGDAAGASYHGTHTSCTFAGNDAPNGNASLRDGLAKGAKIYFLDAGGTTNAIIVPGDLNDYFQPPYTGNGGGAARVSSNSWGSDTGGAYTIECMNSDQFVYAHPDFLISFSNGNAGTAGSVGSPAAAKDCLSSGATGNGASANTLGSFESRGPTLDNRFKPTVCSPGTLVSAYGGNDTGYQTLGGTSMSSPNLAGSAVLVREYFMNGWYPTGAAVPANALTPSSALLRAMMVNSGTDDFASFTMPDNNIGWGRILLDDALYFTGDARRLLVLDAADGVATGEAREYQFYVSDASQPLEVTLVWTDPASNPSAAINLVDDLDLVVEEGANTYHGNVWAAGQSVTGGVADSRNVEENFRRTTPVVGPYTVRVEGANVPFGPQAFAIVVTGGVGASAGVLTLDASSYGPSKNVGIRVEDGDAGASVSVTLTSPSEPGGETVSIGGANGVYQGSVPLTLVAASGGDGKLSVSQGDVITVTYTDSSPAHVATATATIDGDNPTITNVAADPADVTAVVSWTTSAGGTSQIEYGTTTSLGTTSPLDLSLVTSHSHQVSGLVPETTYYFDVLSVDHKGNVVRDDFGGMHYRFTTGKRADILIVIADNTTDKTYRYPDALHSTGWTFNQWGKAQASAPAVGNSSTGLRSYKAVWWQVGWEQYPPFENAVRDSITALHDNGARIAFVTHDTGWAFTDPTSGFSTGPRIVWYNNIMHATFVNDPATFSILTGYAGDPISGAYTGGVSYTPFRSGGAGDEVTKLDGTGTSFYMWRDNAAPARDVGVRWESAAPLGTPGVGIWGGQKTRVAYMGYEWIQFDDATENDATRAAILDKTIQWLIGADHPDAVVVGPNGGETFTTSPVSISWTSSADGINGRSIATTRLEYSDDGGRSWNLITTSPGTSPYSWDVSALPTGTTYRVRAVVTDNGTPVLGGSDASNANFTVAIPGNETRGPVVLAGSPGVSPSPITQPVPATLIATISDALTGGSNVTAAEWSAGGSPAAPGSGTAMSGPFGTVQVAVSAVLATAGLPGGATTLWVRGQDAAGNWGPAAALPVQVNGGGTDAGTPDVVLAFALGQNYPNPFASGTSIRFALPEPSNVHLKVFNVQGRLVRTLLDAARPAGRYTVSWDGRDEAGRAVASGVYFYRITAGQREAERRMIYLR